MTLTETPLFAVPGAVTEKCVAVDVAELIVKVEAFDVTLSGDTTVTLALPAVVIRPADTAAVSCVALANVVVNAVPPHLTVSPKTNPVPFTVSVNAPPPAVAEAGLRLVITGGGALTT